MSSYLRPRRPGVPIFFTVCQTRARGSPDRLAVSSLHRDIRLGPVDPEFSGYVSSGKFGEFA